MKFPEQRAINEHSLQVLSAYLENLKRGSLIAQSKSLPFYLRNNKDKSEPFRLVKLPLKQERDTKTFIMKILKTCDLETNYVESLPSPPSPSKRASNYYQQQQKEQKTHNYTVNNDEGPFAEEFDLFQFKVRKAKEDETLEKFLKKNLDLATIRTMGLHLLREEIQRLKLELEKKLELKEIKYK